MLFFEYDNLDRPSRRQSVLYYASCNVSVRHRWYRSITVSPLRLGVDGWTAPKTSVEFFNQLVRQ